MLPGRLPSQIHPCAMARAARRRRRGPSLRHRNVSLRSGRHFRQLAFHLVEAWAASIAATTACSTRHATSRRLTFSSVR